MVATKSKSGLGATRLASLDQFRGYTVAGMLLVNFLGGFACIHALLKHHNTYCSYADTIMPHFFFAVGFGFRLTFVKRVERGERTVAYWRIARRVVGLLLLGFVVYHLDGRFKRWADMQALGAVAILKGAFKRSFFQTLTHIAVTTLWVAPVIAARGRTRLIFAVASGVLHVLVSGWFNYGWVHADPRAIDGGPLGFLTWTLPLIAGSLACDAVSSIQQRGASIRRVAARIALAGALVSAFGWGLSTLSGLYDVPVAERQSVKGEARFAASPVRPPLARAVREPGLLATEPPFVAPPPPQVRRWSYWHMSQRAGTLSYQTFAAGLSLLVFALFLILADVWGVRVGLFRTLGRNALVAYVLDFIVADAIKPFAPGDAPMWWALGTFAVHLGIVWLFCRHLEKQRIFVRV